MTTYTKESLEKINKRGMINIVLSLQNKLEEANKHALAEIRKLSNAFLKSQSELTVSQQVNSLLSNRLTNMGRKSWENNQYSRGACRGVICIPSERYADVLEEKVLNIFVKLGCDNPPERIETCHRIWRRQLNFMLFGQSRELFRVSWSAK